MWSRTTAHKTLNNQRKPENIYFCFQWFANYAHILLFHTVLMYSCVCVVPLIHIMLCQNAIITIKVFVTYFLVFVHLKNVQYKIQKAVITKGVMYLCLPYNSVSSSWLSHISTDDYDPIKLSNFPQNGCASKALKSILSFFLFLFLFSVRKLNWHS